MPRGGFRPGGAGGRPKGSKDTKPRKRRVTAVTPAKATAKPSSKARLAGHDDERFPLPPGYVAKITSADEMAALTEAAIDLPPGVTLTPLAYALSVINDVGVSAERRDRMAIAAMNFVHGKIAETGKKAARKEAAAEAGKSGRFATPVPPPKLVVNNA